MCWYEQQLMFDEMISVFVQQISGIDIVCVDEIILYPLDLAVMVNLYLKHTSYVAFK